MVNIGGFWVDPVERVKYLGNVKYELSRQERCERNTELITKAGYNIERRWKTLLRIYKNL